VYQPGEIKEALLKAVRLVKVGNPLQMQEVDLPGVTEESVLVEIKAAGICRSDVHYRAGTSPTGPLPLTLGHEIAGIVKERGSKITNLKVGDRVCLHYQLSCGNCCYCLRGMEQFCIKGMMLGKHCDGGYAEYIAVPARNAVLLPEEISLEQGAIMMCSSSSSFHALKKAKIEPGETVAIFGVGGLGISAIQIAKALGASKVYAVDIKKEKLKLAEEQGAIPVDAKTTDPVAKIRHLTSGKGVNIALEVVGLPQTMSQAIQSLSIFGRAVIVGITDRPFKINSYQELVGKEAQVMGSSDHLLKELPILIELARQGNLDLSRIVTRTIPLEARIINQVMDDMENFSDDIRTVIIP
jgi:propanol-preferring alcohol dehydrogenase